ncbi:MAG: tRNA pseudouridine(55) synthase TruB [Clostridia bacterium]|nr:tRNA pseudouridine(55) synthase TruB [Clostridia bacterium]
MNGFLNLYKPEGVSSAYLLNGLKRILKGETIGHMGTLDPLASGVLPVAIGKSTRLFDYLLDKKKEYEATVEFGYETDTLDLEGEKAYFSEHIPTLKEVEEAAKDLVGEIMQIPPVYSAKCVDGKRSYKLARQGKQVELPPKKVIVYSIEVLDFSDSKCKLKIVCGGGTYIRAIARDLGLAVSSRATMTSLKRTASGIFKVEDSVTIEDIKNSRDMTVFIIPPDKAIDYPIIDLSETEAKRLFNGLADEFLFDDGIYKVYAPDGFYGVGEVRNKNLKVKAYIRDDKNC